MLYAVFGTPSPFASLGLKIIKSLAESGGNDVDFITSISGEDLRKSWSERSTQQTIVFSDAPDAQIASVFRNLRYPLLAFLDEPGDVVHYVMHSRGTDCNSAMRFTSQCFACLHDLLLSDASLVIDRATCPTPQALLAVICEHLKISIPVDALTAAGLQRDASIEKEIVRLYGADAASNLWKIDLPLEDRALIEFAFENYVGEKKKKPIQVEQWPTGMFFDAAANRIEGSVELSGPSRMLIYGPYLHLPIGKWSLWVVVSVAENLSSSPIDFEVLNPSCVTKGMLLFPPSGNFGFSVTVEVFEPREPVILTFTSRNSFIEGSITLTSVTIERAENRRRGS